MSQRRTLVGPRARLSPSVAGCLPSSRRSSVPCCASQDDILNLFYDEYVHKLAGPIAGGAKQLQGGTGPINGEADGGAAGGANGELDDLPDLGVDNVLSTQQHVCELLCFCVQARAPPRPPRHTAPASLPPATCRLPFAPALVPLMSNLIRLKDAEPE